MPCEDSLHIVFCLGQFLRRKDTRHPSSEHLLGKGQVCQMELMGLDGSEDAIFREPLLPQELAAPAHGLVMRPLQTSDVDKGYLELLSQVRGACESAARQRVPVGHQGRVCVCVTLSFCVFAVEVSARMCQP